MSVIGKSHWIYLYYSIRNNTGGYLAHLFADRDRITDFVEESLDKAA